VGAYFAVGIYQRVPLAMNRLMGGFEYLSEGNYGEAESSLRSCDAEFDVLRNDLRTFMSLQYPSLVGLVRPDVSALIKEGYSFTEIASNLAEGGALLAKGLNSTEEGRRLLIEGKAPEAYGGFREAVNSLEQAASQFAIAEERSRQMDFETFEPYMTGASRFPQGLRDLSGFVSELALPYARGSQYLAGGVANLTRVIDLFSTDLLKVDWLEVGNEVRSAGDAFESAISQFSARELGALRKVAYDLGTSCRHLTEAVAKALVGSVKDSLVACEDAIKERDAAMAFLASFTLPPAPRLNP